MAVPKLLLYIGCPGDKEWRVSSIIIGQKHSERRWHHRFWLVLVLLQHIRCIHVVRALTKPSCTKHLSDGVRPTSRLISERSKTAMYIHVPFT